MPGCHWLGNAIHSFSLNPIIPSQDLPTCLCLQCIRRFLSIQGHFHGFPAAIHRELRQQLPRLGIRFRRIEQIEVCFDIAPLTFFPSICLVEGQDEYKKVLVQSSNDWKLLAMQPKCFFAKRYHLQGWRCKMSKFF